MISFKLKVMMNALSIALLIFSLMAPAGSSGSSDWVGANQSAAVEAGRPLLALANSDERSDEKEAENPSIRWYKRKNNTKLNGAALVIHGLNSRPDKMKSIISRMNDFGIDCLNLSLRGHGENHSAIDKAESADARMEAFKSVSYPLWKSEAYQAYRRVERRSHLCATPMFFVGFSMGGLLGVDLLSSGPRVTFDKMVQDQNLDQWKIYPVKKDKTVKKIKMHHLIIDEACVGKNMWHQIVEVILTHFLGPQPADTSFAVRCFGNN